MDDDLKWYSVMKRAIELYLSQEVRPRALDRREGGDLLGHTAATPDRVVRTFTEMVEGYHKDPEKILEEGSFPSTGLAEMIHIRDIRIVSTCAHHLLPIIGTAHFAYVPSSKIVGLSKIPRFIHALSRRLQLQETLSSQIVDTFMNVVRPSGCGVSIRAIHCCMMSRGVKEQSAYTETTALRGVFFDDRARDEFLRSVDKGIKL